MGAHGVDGCYRRWELEEQANLSLWDVRSFFILSRGISPFPGSPLLPSVSWPGSLPSLTVYGSSYLHHVLPQSRPEVRLRKFSQFQIYWQQTQHVCVCPMSLQSPATRQVYIIENRVFWLSQRVHGFSFEGHRVTLVTTQLSWRRVTIIMDNIQEMMHNGAPTKVYF